MTEQTERDRDNDNILRPSWFLINYAVSPSSNTVSYDPGIAGNLICISCKPNLFVVFSPLLYRKSSFFLGFLFLLLFFYLFYLMVQVIDKPKIFGTLLKIPTRVLNRNNYCLFLLNNRTNPSVRKKNKNVFLPRVSSYCYSVGQNKKETSNLFNPQNFFCLLWSKQKVKEPHFNNNFVVTKHELHLKTNK